MEKFLFRVPRHKVLQKNPGAGQSQKMPVNFRKFFSNPELRADENLWKAFLRWRHEQEFDDFAKFQEDLLKVRDEAKKQMDAWPSPFVNAKKGVEYRITFQLPPCAHLYKFSNLEKMGLELVHKNQDVCTLAGIPQEAGEFQITLLYTSRELKKFNKALYRNFKIVVNPDPRELWKNIPTSRGIEYFRPDEASEILKCGNMTMLAASIRGRSHAHSGAPRDDDFALRCHNGWNIMVVADGAGSAQYSRRGAELACSVAADVCLEKLDESPALETHISTWQPGSETWLPRAKTLAYAVLPYAANQARLALREEAAKKGRDIKDYATTLLLAMTKHFEAGWAVISFQIGDGAMALLRGNGNTFKATLLAEPDEGEFGGQTRFVTMPDVFNDGQSLVQRLHIELAPDFEALILMSDGISDPRFSTLANLRNSELWREFWVETGSIANSADAQAKLLEWLPFWSHGNHDDRTIAILHRAPVANTLKN